MPCTTSATLLVVLTLVTLISPVVVLYVAVPIFLLVPSSLKVIAVPFAIVPDFVPDDAAVAADAKSTDDRFRLEAG